MSVGILIISHDGIGASIFGTANFRIREIPLDVKLLSASRDSDVDTLLEKATSLIEELDTGDGVLVMTDLVGSTPNNIACKLFEHARMIIVTGLNLSMIIRVLNYPELDLEQLAEKAYSGAIDGVSIDRG